MAYHGYIPFIAEYLKNFNRCTILEIGVNTGISTFALVSRLDKRNQHFTYLGVDILIRPDVVETIKYMGLNDISNVMLSQSNSLQALDDLVKQNVKFDVILLDGDHNYYTVSRELPQIDLLMHENTLLVADDYKGKWSSRDLYYGDNEEYRDNTIATKRKDVQIDADQKQGVQPAIDEFLLERKHLRSGFLMEGEPIMIWNERNKIING